ncbi:MAG: hypothetical protein QGG40_21165, partial [Myxococcota bacterium]|nr:hypothetical protein [Myxococcota bacterium]
MREVYRDVFGEALEQRRAWWEGSGPLVAWSFHRLYAAVLLIAWTSLAVQVPVLFSSRGIAPIAGLVARLEEKGLIDPLRLPSLFLWVNSDAVLFGTAWLGAVLAGLA